MAPTERPVWYYLTTDGLTLLPPEAWDTLLPTDTPVLCTDALAVVRADAQIVSTFYRSLVDAGIDPEIAGKLTSEWAARHGDGWSAGYQYGRDRAIKANHIRQAAKRVASEA